MNKARPHRPSGKKKPTSAPKLTFFIESLDALGQGVHKEAGQINFIAKTLPGESGTARITSQKKGVRFAQVEKLDQLAENRIEPVCPHFSTCPGCAYLHTDYESELAYKKSALQQLLHHLPAALPEIELTPAPERLHYRNRVQLHYRHKYIGILDGDNDQILEVPNCKLPHPSLQNAIMALYENKDWSREHQGSGHCEIALVDGKVQQVWDQPYAHGGFTQVYGAMNSVLKAEVARHAETVKPRVLLDLFSGNGNLSDEIVHNGTTQRHMIDMTDYTHPDFTRLDLFDEQALSQFKKRTSLKKVDVMLVDPPRKGFPNLADWVACYKPDVLVYISCNAATMARDLKNLSGRYSIEHLQLLDMFPATKHFETLAVIKF